jgi:ABC-type phosphate/phosphonate transport system ATPase subunit
MRIEASRLTVDFPARGVRALAEVDVVVPEGARVAVLGRSGSGKTTLLRAVLGAVVPATGDVTVDGVDPVADVAPARAARRATGLVRQGGDLVLAVSGRVNALAGTTTSWTPADWLRLARGRAPRAWEERLLALARAHGVEACLDARAAELSGGQRQRIALLRALLPGPRLLLADEPTAGLDPTTATAAVDALLATGVTLVVATHDLGVARRFPRVLGLRDGRLVHDGPPPDAAEAADLYAPRHGLPPDPAATDRSAPPAAPPPGPQVAGGRAP